MYVSGVLYGRNVLDLPAGEARKGTRTGRANESNGIVNLPAAPEGRHKQTARMNQSRHITNLTPAPVKRTTSRTSRINQETSSAASSRNMLVSDRITSHSETLRSPYSSMAWQVNKYASNNRQMQSSVFSAPQQQQSARSSTRFGRLCLMRGLTTTSSRVHHAPGGKSQFTLG